MNAYRQTFTIRSCDVDGLRRLRLSSLFTMLQEASIAHTTELGMGRGKTLDKGLLWIITLQQAKINRLPVYDETIELLTWPNPTMHLYFPRSYRILDQAGRTLIDASFLWALMDSNTRRIVFPEQYGISIHGSSAKDDPLPAQVPRLPALTVHSDYTVPYSYTDLNGHMNNTRYFDLAEDLMTSELRGKSIDSIQTQFTAEAKLGETIHLSYSEEQQNCFALSGAMEKQLFRLLLKYHGGESIETGAK